MDLKQLRSKGAFVKAPPLPTEVTWVHEDESGETMEDTFTVHIRRMSVGWLDRVLLPGADPRRSRTAALIAEGVLFGENGAEQMTYDEAYQLDPGLATVLIQAFHRVNKGGDAAHPKS